MNKVYRNIMRIFSLICFVTIILLSTKSFSNVIKAAEGTNTPTEVKILDSNKEELEDDKITIAQSSYKTSFYVRIKGDSGLYNLYLETSDGTLLSSENEYTTISSSSIYASTTINSGETYGYISVTVEMAKKVKDYIEVEGYPNYFYVNIVKVNKTNYNKSLKVECESSYTYETKTSDADNKSIVLKMYESINQQTLVNDSKRVDNGRNSVTQLDINLSNTYDSKTQHFIQNKLANYYVSTGGQIAWDNSFDYALGLVEYNLYNGTLANPISTTSFVTNTWSGWDSVKPGANAAFGDSSKHWTYSDNILTKNIFDISNGDQYWQDHTYVHKENVKTSYYFAESTKGDTFYQIDNSTNNNPYITLTNYSGAYNYKNFIASCGAYTYTKKTWKETYELTQDSNRKLDYKNWYAKSFIADTTCPTVSNAYLLNSNSKTTFNKNDKVQIAIRFSEPVQVLDTKALSIQLNTNSYNANINPVKFNYKSGSGTYTLIFEADASSYQGIEVNINQIRSIDFVSSSDTLSKGQLIRDFSSNLYTAVVNGKNQNDSNNAYTKGGYFNGYQYSCNVEYNIDTRTPKVTITPDIKTLSKDKKLTIEFSNTATNATFYYKFIKEADLETLSDEDWDKDLQELDTTQTHDIDDSNKTGKYYIYYKIVSYYGISSSNKDVLLDSLKRSDYELLYDNNAPIIIESSDSDTKANKLTFTNALDSSGNKLNDSYNFTVYLKDLEESYTNKLGEFSRIQNISFIYSENEFSFNSSIGSITLYNADTSSYARIKCDSSDKYKYTFNVSYSDLSDTFIDKSQDVSTLYVGITIEDTAGNIYTYTNDDFISEIIKFDSRTKLEGSLSSPDEENKIYSLDIYKKGTTVSFTADDSIDVSGGEYKALVYKITYNNDTKKTIKELVDASSNIYNLVIDERVATITFNESGYYEYQFVLNNTMYSDNSLIYIGSNIENGDQGDNTYNTNNNDIVINNVWSTNSLQYYYYGDSSVVREYYNGTSNSQMFSSSSYLSQYIKFYEYQDLSLVITNSAIATSLNSSASTTYQKASGETRTAAINELWIRYKKASWNYSTSTTEWVYYYYGNYNGSNDSINVLNLSVNLKNAINSVTQTIVSKCSNVNLVTDEYLNNGVPYLASNRVHPNKEEAKNSRTNTVLQNVNFTGDSGIYSSYTSIGNNNFYYFSNYKFIYTPYTKLYYANVVEENNFVFSSLTELKIQNGETLNNILPSGTYVLVEIDEFGISKTFIYIVNYTDAPALNIIYSSKSEENISQTLNYQNNGERYNVTSFAIDSLGDSIDNYAFVRVTNRNSQSTYYYSDFIEDGVKKDPILLTDGTYTIFVSDRFANSYSFTVSVNSSDIKYTFNVIDSERLRFTCDLEADDVFSFSITLNGEVITNQYAKTINLTKSGTYVLSLTDIYGNTVNQTEVLERKNPQVNWYYVSGNTYEYFDESSTTGAILRQISTSSYEIYTSARVQFQYEGDYLYEFSDGVDYTTSTWYSSKRVSITSEEYFTVKIYYSDNEEAQVTYKVIFDKDPADIEATISTHNYSYHDLVSIDEATRDEYGNITNLNIKDIGFDTKSSDTYGILDNGKVYSKNINLRVSDASGISKITITLDGNIVTLTEDIINQINNNEKEIILSLTEIGKYVIEVTDILGNVSTLTFENVSPDYFGYVVDDNRISLLTDPDEAYNKEDNKQFGHDSIVYNFNQISQLVFFIDNTYFSLVVRDNSLYLVYYSLNDSIYTLVEKLLIDNTNSSYKTIDEFSIDGIDLSYRYLNDSFYFMIKALNGDVHSISSRTISDYSYTPFYTVIELCSKLSSLDFINVDESSVNLEELNGYTNQEFTINKSALDSDITSIKYALNTTNNFDGITLNDLDLTQDFKTFGANDGYVKFVATNKYGMVTTYIIRVFRQLLVEVDVTYSDLTSISYTYEANLNYYSNNSITIRSYEPSTTFTVYKDSQSYEIESSKYSDRVEITLNESGNYLINITDSSNNKRVVSAYISNDEFNVTDDIFKGLNNDALRKEDLYTNTLVSIDSKLIDTYSIYRIEMSYNDSTYKVYYDNISQDRITNVSLNDLIGLLGDGVYRIKFRNIYGSYCLKEIHYSSTSSLVIERMTRSEFEYSIIDMSKVDEGVYTNNLVRFTSTASLYEFKIDGQKVDCPYEMSFPKGSSTGSYTYLLTYVDEYGFNYSFTLYLIRQSVNYTVSSETKTIDGINTITRDFYIAFDSDSYIGEYSIGDNYIYSYTDKELLTRDGTYSFTITDRAGNISTFTIKKDTIVEFSAIESQTNRTVINGDISNNGNVVISGENKEYVKVVKAYLNSVERDVSSSYNDNGKWELLIEDNAGNQTYFTFYIYTHTISKLAYQTPYNYKFKNILYTDLSGNSQNYMDKVVDNTTFDSITFDENGEYYVEMISQATNLIVTFELSISNIAPNVELVNVENNGTTFKNVTLTGYKVGDIIRIYKDGKLSNTITVISANQDSPVISEKGDYTIEITNEEGNVTTLHFRRQYTANAASSTVIVVVLSVIAIVLFIGLFSRKREKID